ncbi:MAG: serpin family protein [Actinomycetota bacterium]
MTARHAVLLAASLLVVAACGDTDTERATAGDPGTDTRTDTDTDTHGTVRVDDGAAPSPSGSSPSGSEPPPAAPNVGLDPAAFGSDLERAPIDPGAPVDALVTGWNDAGFDLLRREAGDENVVFSSASIGHALQMASAAGDPATRSVIESAFGLPVGSHDAWNALDQQIAATQSDQVTVTIADRIWPRSDVQPDQAWIDLLASRHGADVVGLDYAGAPDASRDVINDWVSDQTGDLIPELLPDGFVDPQTLLVLTDTVYFAAEWAVPFGKYGPVDGTFTTAAGDEVDIEFLRELELFDRRGVGDGFVGAEIPYAGGEWSMLVLVPDAGRFDEVVGRLDQRLLDEIDASFTTGPYELLLPTWSTNHQIDLLPWLAELGMVPGRFPGIAPGAVLDAAVHAADITVDENGTVAAAATALGFAESGAPDPELTIAADRPFVYVIRHRDSGLALFTGTVSDPR